MKTLEPLSSTEGGMQKFTTRPVVMGTHGAVTSGHYLSSLIGVNILQQGGTAIDAGVAMGFASTVLEPYLLGIGGEVPILIYSADLEQVISINGQGFAPQDATIDWFLENKIDLIPGDGFLPATVPGAVDGWITALTEFGSMTLESVLNPSIKLATAGFPMYAQLYNRIQAMKERFINEWPGSANVYFPNGKTPDIGQIFKQKDWAMTFKGLIQEEQKNKSLGREAALSAARDYFYQGPIAKRIIEYSSQTPILDSTGNKHTGLLTMDDFEAYHAKVEDPISLDYHGLTIHKCNTWCQGAVLLQHLSLLKGYNLKSMTHNSVEYLHLLIESSKLAFADREQFYGDPDFVEVPLKRLLSEEYAKARRELIDPDKSSIEFRPGDGSSKLLNRGPEVSSTHRNDTTHLEAIDNHGNMISATPSGGWLSSSPVIPGLGFQLGTRAQMFSLDPTHPNSLQPHKRPRTTLTPSMVTKKGRPYMTFGTPGGDMQDQWTLQFFINFVEFGMNLQEALDAPTYHSDHVPTSFYPREAFPGRVSIEGRVPENIRNGLTRIGHEIIIPGDWEHGRCLAILYDEENGVISAGASPRRETGYALAW